DRNLGHVRSHCRAPSTQDMAGSAPVRPEEQVPAASGGGRSLEGLAGRGGHARGKGVARSRRKALDVCHRSPDFVFLETILPGGHGGFRNAVPNNTIQIVFIESAPAKSWSPGRGSAGSMAISDRTALGEDLFPDRYRRYL